MDITLRAFFVIIHVHFVYAAISVDLCSGTLMTRRMRTFTWSILSVILLVSCEIVDDDMDKHVDKKSYVSLEEVAKVLAHAAVGNEHIKEVFDAVSSSCDNGYDEEYTIADMFACPGAGVGDEHAVKSSSCYTYPLCRLIEDYVYSANLTKSPQSIADPDKWLEAIRSSDMQIYWPFSENWDGTTMPIITFDPEDGSEANIGYRLVTDNNGFRHIEEVVVDEKMAAEMPVWVMNRNSDAGYTTLEMLRKEDPEWGQGGGSITVTPKSAANQHRMLIMKDFTAMRNFDSWLAGASEHFVRISYLKDFTASTEAEMLIYNPLITDFMIVVRRSQVGKILPYNVVLLTDWSKDMESCAFMITEDDGGTRTEWNCKAKVFIEGKSYGVELTLPFRSRDDIVWRGMLDMDMLEEYSGQQCRYGDVAITFEVI